MPSEKPRVVFSRCTARCRCQRGGEWIVRVPWCVVDVDNRTSGELLSRRAAARAQLEGAQLPPVIALVRSARGGVHFHLDAPLVQLGTLCEWFGGDATHARISVERGWSGERPAPRGAIDVVTELPIGAELVRAHRLGRMMVATARGSFDAYAVTR